MNITYYNYFSYFSTEKEIIADYISKYVLDKYIYAPADEYYNFLDIGSGNGLQAKLIAEKLAIKIEKLYISMIEKNYELSEICKIITGNNSIRSDVTNVQWENYNPTIQYDFILCSHVLGSLFKQCKNISTFRNELFRILLSGKKTGIICIILGDENSINLKIRNSLFNNNDTILSAQKFSMLLDDWRISYKSEYITSHLNLTGWLNSKSLTTITSIESGIFNFLFSDCEQIPVESLNRLRDTLLVNSILWDELTPLSKEYFVLKFEDNIDINNMFVELSQRCFWIETKGTDNGDVFRL